MIRCFTFLICFAFIGSAFSQADPGIFKLDSIPRKGIKLVEGWQFYPTENPIYDSIRYHDEGWQDVNPTIPLRKLPRVKKAGIGWLRLKIKVDSSLFNQAIAMVLTTHGATEIYLNDEAIYSFGKVDPRYQLEETRYVAYRPFSFKLGNTSAQELTVRLSYNKKNLYLEIVNSACLQIILTESNQAFIDYTRHQALYQNIRMIQVSLYLPLGLLLFFFYRSYRLRSETCIMRMF